MVKNAETTVGITVFFDENMAEADILAIGKEIAARKEIKKKQSIFQPRRHGRHSRRNILKMRRNWRKALRMITAGRIGILRNLSEGYRGSGCHCVLSEYDCRYQED